MRLALPNITVALERGPEAGSFPKPTHPLSVSLKVIVQALPHASSFEWI